MRTLFLALQESGNIQERLELGRTPRMRWHHFRANGIVMPKHQHHTEFLVVFEFGPSLFVPSPFLLPLAGSSSALLQSALCPGGRPLYTSSISCFGLWLPTGGPKKRLDGRKRCGASGLPTPSCLVQGSCSGAFLCGAPSSMALAFTNSRSLPLSLKVWDGNSFLLLLAPWELHHPS